MKYDPNNAAIIRCFYECKYNIIIAYIYWKHLVNTLLQSRYFMDEIKDKSGQEIDVRSWDVEFVEDLPEQQNG